MFSENISVSSMILFLLLYLSPVAADVFTILV